MAVDGADAKLFGNLGTRRQATATAPARVVGGHQISRPAASCQIVIRLRRRIFRLVRTMDYPFLYWNLIAFGLAFVSPIASIATYLALTVEPCSASRPELTSMRPARLHMTTHANLGNGAERNGTGRQAPH
jgi:hypothetical protein